MNRSTPIAGRYLFDTNVVIALFDGKTTIEEATAKAREIFLPSIVVGELYYGAFSSQQVADNQTRLEHFVDSVTVLPCDEETALHFGRIKNGLRAKGRPIPDNDLWIAAIAQQHGLTLVTRDEHFHQVKNLRQESW